MTTYNKGDVVLVPFPFSNQIGSKKRPAIIISSQNYNKSKQDLIIMAITSQISKTLKLGECAIQDWKLAGLLKQSSIKPLISSIEQSLILKKLGNLSPSDITSLNKILKEILDLSFL